MDGGLEVRAAGPRPAALGRASYNSGWTVPPRGSTADSKHPALHVRDQSGGLSEANCEVVR